MVSTRFPVDFTQGSTFSDIHQLLEGSWIVFVTHVAAILEHLYDTRGVAVLADERADPYRRSDGAGARELRCMRSSLGWRDALSLRALLHDVG